MKWISVSIEKIKVNPENPRIKKDLDYKELIESIKRFPKMLEIRPIVVNSDYMILGGDKRFKACKEIGLKQIPVVFADDLSEEEQRGFIIKDNVSAGDWDVSLLRENWAVDELKAWGVQLPTGTDKVPAKVEFSEFLGECSNYVVLFFENEIDWLGAQTHFNLKTVAGKRSNGKEWNKGIGRVVNGAQYLDRLNQEKEENDAV